MKKQFLTPKLTHGLNRLLDREEQRSREGHSTRDRVPRGDVRTALFVLHESIDDHVTTVAATKLVPIADRGDTKAFQVVFDQSGSDTATLTINGTTLGSAFDKDSTTADVVNAITAALGSNSGVAGAAVAGNVFIWGATTVTAGTGEPEPVEVVYRPLINETAADTVSAPRLEPGLSYAKGSTQYCLWVTGAGWCVLAGTSGSGSGSGGGSCNCCSSVSSGDMLHPHLPAGSNETVRTWAIADGCGGSIEPISMPNSAATGRTVWDGGLHDLDYDSSDHKFRRTIPAIELTVYDNAGNDVTGTPGVTKSGSIEMDWSIDPPTISITLDSTIP